MVVFAVEPQIVRTTSISCSWGDFQSGMYVEGWRKYWKIRFYGIYMEVKQLGHNVIKMKLKMSWKWFSTTSTIEVFGEEVAEV